jgi:hypothetical protein
MLDADDRGDGDEVIDAFEDDCGGVLDKDRCCVVLDAVILRLSRSLQTTGRTTSFRTPPSGRCSFGLSMPCAVISPAPCNKEEESCDVDRFDTHS